MESATSKDENISSTRNVHFNLIEIAENDEQRHPRAILQTSPSTISFDTASNLPRTVLDHLDDIYTCRTHRQCVDLSYSTLMLMTIAVFSWISYWLTYNRCANLSPPEPHSFLCALVTIFEVITFGAIILTPFLIIIMILAWIRYACRNPFDQIREDCVGVRLQEDQWKNQVEYFLGKKQRWFSRRRKQREELLVRNCGHVILSPHGIVIDEIKFFTARKHIFDNGILMNEGHILKLHFRRRCHRSWKSEVQVFLPDDYVNRRTIEELERLLAIHINNDAISPPCF